MKRRSATRDVYRTITTGLNGTSMPAYSAALDARQICALVYYLENLIPDAHKRSPREMLGEEQRGWIIVRMPGMMRHRTMR
ncbi:MAG: c-type cytochrome [Candidatus Binatia bacterium]